MTRAPKVGLTYTDASPNGRLLFTVAATDKDTGEVYHQHRFDLENAGERATFCRKASDALGSPESLEELDRRLLEYADRQHKQLAGQYAVAAAAAAGATAGRLGSPLAAYQPFPTHVLPYALRQFVREAAVAVGCDESFVALPLLVGMASVIGNSRVVRITHDWREPCVLWAAVIAGSGERKSPPFFKALKALHDMQAEAVKEYRAEMERYKREVLEYKRELALFKVGEATDPPEEPRRPVLKRLVVIDTTVEALVARLEENPRGLALIRDELSAWFASFGQYKSGKGGDSAQWLEMHRAGAVSVDRKTGDRPSIFVPRAAVSVAGTIQPGILARSLGGEHFESGMAARFLFAMPPARTRQWSDASIEPHTRDRIATVYARLAALEPGADGEPVDVPLTAAAQARYVTFVNEHGLEQDALESQNLKAAWSKLEGAAARLALVIHLVRAVTNDSSLADDHAVDDVSMDAGITLARWFGNEARRVYAGISQTAPERDREWLLDKIRGLGGRITARQLQNGWRRYKTADAARAALAELVEAGLGKFVRPGADGKGGRPTEVFELIEPAADDHIADEHTIDSADSADADKTPRGDAPAGVLSAGGADRAGSVGASTIIENVENVTAEAFAIAVDETPSNSPRADETPAGDAPDGVLSASAVSARTTNDIPAAAPTVRIVEVTV